ATTASTRQAIRVRGQVFVDKVKELIHEGNVRRIVIKNDEGHTVLEIPVTAGVVAAVVAPALAAIGAIAALANEWSIEVEQDERRLSTLVGAGVPVRDEIIQLARLVAAFHGSARRGPAISAEGTRGCPAHPMDRQLHPGRRGPRRHTRRRDGDRDPGPDPGLP